MVGPYINTWPSRFQPRGLPDDTYRRVSGLLGSRSILTPNSLSGIRRPAKKALNPIAARPIEVFRNTQLTCHEAQALCLAFVLGAYWDELSKRFPFWAIMKPPSFARRLIKSAKWAST